MNTNHSFENFEKKVMEKLLDGSDSTLEVLRQQYIKAKVKSREFSGTGFYTNFEVPDDVQIVESKKSFQLGDVVGHIDGVNDGVGFILFIKDGVLDFLEGYTYGDERWSDSVTTYRLYYMSGDVRNLEEIKNKWEEDSKDNYF